MASVSWFITISFFLYVLCLFFLTHKGFSDGSIVLEISSLCILKAIMGRIVLNQKEAPSAALPVANPASTKNEALASMCMEL